MRKHKKLLFVLVAVVVVLGSTTAYAAFSDVMGTTHEEGINWALDNGITIGYNDNTYRPDNPVTRGQMATFLYRFNNEIVEPGDANGGGGGDVSGTCGTCHDDTTVITGKRAQWAHSTELNDDIGMALDDGLGHAGELYWIEGDSTGCAGCHSGGTFSNRVAAGVAPNAVTAAMVTEKTPIDCRACHKVHETGTAADWALETVAPVTLFATPTRTFDGGSGNLCAQCHQARRTIPAPANSTETTVSVRFNTHPSPQASALVGTAAAAANGTVLQGTPMMHYSGVADTCVSCHMVEGDHTFEPDVEACTPCHGTRDDFDIGGFQTSVITQMNAIGAELASLGLLTATGETAENGMVEYNQNNTGLPKLVPTAQAVALWNYMYIIEDASYGVHNPGYFRALLDAADNILP